MNQTLSLEQQLSDQIYQSTSDRSSIDKVLARTDAEEIKNIMAKETLTRKEISLLLYLMVSNELKLLNFSEQDRYLSGKFYVWVRQFAQLTEQIYDYSTKVESMSEKELNMAGIDKDVFEMLKQIRDRFVHMVKFLADIYLYLNRSTMSYEASGFNTLTTQRTEMIYPQQQFVDPVKKQGMLSFIGR